MTKGTIVAALALAACSAAEAPPAFQPVRQPAPKLQPAPKRQPARAPEAEPLADGSVDERFVPVMTGVFREYVGWGRWDDELRWAPYLCRMPEPGQARFSEADHGGHARKLYSVFAKEHDAYGDRVTLGHMRAVQPVGQILVKEAYYPEKVTHMKREPVSLTPELGEVDHFDRYVREGEQLYRASELAGIYVLAKVAPDSPGTDQGWIYGTVAADGTVTSAGRLGSCMGCHVVAETDRVFGM